MSSIDIPWGKAPQRKQRQTRVRVECHGNLELFASDGQYEIWQGGARILGPIDETSARTRYQAILTPQEDQRREEIEAEAPATAPSSTHTCPSCGAEVSDERKSLLGVVTCPKCTPQAGPVYGVLDYSHKTGGVLMITENKRSFDMMKKPINKQR